MAEPTTAEIRDLLRSRVTAWTTLDEDAEWFEDEAGHVSTCGLLIALVHVFRDWINAGNTIAMTQGLDLMDDLLGLTSRPGRSESNLWTAIWTCFVDTLFEPSEEFREALLPCLRGERIRAMFDDYRREVWGLALADHLEPPA